MNRVITQGSLSWDALKPVFLCAGIVFIMHSYTLSTTGKIRYTGVITGSHVKEHRYTPNIFCTTACTRKCSLKKQRHRNRTTIIIPRSVGANTARELVGWQEYIHRFENSRIYGAYAQATGYSRSFDAENITRTLFGCTKISLLGSSVADKHYNNIYADRRDTIRACPVIENFFIDNQFFLGLDPFLCNTYVRIHAPFVYTHWDLHLRTQSLTNTTSTNTTIQPLQSAQTCGKLSNCGLTKAGFADIDLIVGYDYWRAPFGHFGAYIQAVLPTGNKPNPRYLFSPIIGNGGHFELGAGLSGHVIMWQNCFCDTLAVYLEANVTHLFSNTQCRSFNVCHKRPRETSVKNKKNKLIIPEVTCITRNVNSCVPVKGDASVKLTYHSRRFSLDLGYNFYGNTTEKLCIKKADTTHSSMRFIPKLDKRSGRAPATATHKFFSYFSYHAHNYRNYYAYFIGLGTEVEVNALSCVETPSINQWSAYLKAGIAF